MNLSARTLRHKPPLRRQTFNLLFSAEKISCLFHGESKSLAMIKQVVVSISALTVFFWLSDYTLKDKRAGTICSSLLFFFFSFFEKFFVFTPENGHPRI